MGKAKKSDKDHVVIAGGCDVLDVTLVMEMAKDKKAMGAYIFNCLLHRMAAKAKLLEGESQ